MARRHGFWLGVFVIGLTSMSGCILVDRDIGIAAAEVLGRELDFNASICTPPRQALIWAS